jgi:hypothetical protein
MRLVDLLATLDGTVAADAVVTLPLATFLDAVRVDAE